MLGINNYVRNESYQVNEMEEICHNIAKRAGAVVMSGMSAEMAGVFGLSNAKQILVGAVGINQGTVL